MGYFRPESLPSEPWDDRSAREDARLLLMVVRARRREGLPPLVEHADALAVLAQDEHASARRRRIAAELLARLRFDSMPSRTAAIPTPHGRPGGAGRVSDDHRGSNGSGRHTGESGRS